MASMVKLPASKVFEFTLTSAAAVPVVLSMTSEPSALVSSAAVPV